MSPGLEDGPRRMLVSPGLDSAPGSPVPSLDFINYIGNDSDSGDNPLRGLDTPNNINMDPVISTTTGTTTIILPAIGANNHTTIGTGSGLTFSSHRLAPRDPGPQAAKRRRG